jgi:hypothetical protein
MSFDVHFVRLRLERGARHLHSLGPRALAEFLVEVALRSGDGSAISILLGDYEGLTPEMVALAGVGHLAPRLLREVPR